MSCSDPALRQRCRLALGALALTLALAATAAQAQVAIVTAAASSIGRLSLDEAEQLYLGRRTTLADGTPVTLLDLPAGQVRDRFYMSLTGKNPSQTRAYWSRLVFTGRALPPRELGGPAEMRQFLLDNPGSIGYLPDNDKSDPALKVLLRLK